MEEPEDLGYEEQIPDNEIHGRPRARRQSTAGQLLGDLTGALGYGTNMVGTKVGEALTMGAHGIAEVQKFSVDTFEDTKNYLGPEPLFMTVWLLWVAIGTVFYAFAPESNLGFLKGFFMAINIGYSIGFGFPSEYHHPYYYFSVMYVLIGSSFVAVALGFFAEKIAEDQSNWFTIVKKRKKYEEAFSQDKSLYSKVKALVLHNVAVIRALTVWMAFIVVMITYSKVHVGWSITEAQYFAFSTLSTGGHHRIPDDSPPWFFGITGLFAMIGVPITGVAMAQVARGLTSHGDLEHTKSVINADVTAEELKMLIEFGLEDGDGEIDRSEFIILCMVRMGTSPELIDFISKRFEAMDVEGTGGLSIEQISRGNAKFVNGKVRRTASIVGENQAQNAMIAASLHNNLARELSLKKTQSLRKVKRTSMLARQQSNTNKNIAAFLDQFDSSSSDEEDNDDDKDDGGGDNKHYKRRSVLRGSLVASQLADVMEEDEEDDPSSRDLGYGLSDDPNETTTNESSSSLSKSDFTELKRDLRLGNTPSVRRLEDSMGDSMLRLSLDFPDLVPDGHKRTTSNGSSSSLNKSDFTELKRDLRLGNTASVRRLEDSLDDSGLRLALDFPDLAPYDQKQTTGTSIDSSSSLNNGDFANMKRDLRMGSTESVRRLEDSMDDSRLRLALDFPDLAPVESAPRLDKDIIATPEAHESHEHALASTDDQLESRFTKEPFDDSGESHSVQIVSRNAQTDMDNSLQSQENLVFLEANVKNDSDLKLLEESFHSREIRMMLDFPGAKMSSMSSRGGDTALSDDNESDSVATMEGDDYDVSSNTPEVRSNLSSTCKIDLETVEELEHESSRGFRVSDRDDIVISLLEQGVHQVQESFLDLQTSPRNSSDISYEGLEGNPSMLEESSRSLGDTESSDLKDPSARSQFKDEIFDTSDDPSRNQTRLSYPNLIPNSTIEDDDTLLGYLPVKAVEGNPSMTEESNRSLGDTESSDLKDPSARSEFKDEIVDTSDGPSHTRTILSYPNLIPNATNEDHDNLLGHLPANDLDIEANGGLEAIGKTCNIDLQPILDLRETQTSRRHVGKLRVISSPDQLTKVVSDIETPPSSQLRINSTSSASVFDNECTP